MLVLSRKKFESIIVDAPVSPELASVVKRILEHADRLKAAGFESLVMECQEAQQRAAEADRSIKFTIIELRGDKCRVGVEADKNVPVHRQEVYEAIKREKRSAVAPQPAPVVAPSVAPLANFVAK